MRAFISGRLLSGAETPSNNQRIKVFGVITTFPLRPCCRYLETTSSPSSAKVKEVPPQTHRFEVQKRVRGASSTTDDGLEILLKEQGTGDEKLVRWRRMDPVTWGEL
jgi:hypothetical protein